MEEEKILEVLVKKLEMFEKRGIITKKAMEKISLNSRFEEDLGLDMADLFDYAIEIDEEFKIESGMKDMQDIIIKFNTLGDYVNYIKEKKGYK